MAGTRRQLDLTSEFWCINCGNKGIPIVRERGHRRGPGHRKAMYCITCKQTVNHVETRNEEEARKFREDFAAGLFREEAKQSIEFAKNEKLH